MSRLLYQFPHSHFSEKARWALDHKGLDFERVNLMRGPHVRTTRKLGPDSTVPILVEPDGTAIQDSTAILDHLDATYPNAPLGSDDPAKALALEEYFDDKLGFHTRRFAYACLIDRPDALGFIFLQGKGWLLRMAFPLIYRLMKPRMIRRLNLGPGAADESAAEILAALDVIDERLAAGTGYLVGDRFSRADLTAAALLSLLTWPDEHEFEFPPPAMLPERIQAFLDEVKDRPALDWALAMYARHRSPGSAVR